MKNHELITELLRYPAGAEIEVHLLVDEDETTLTGRMSDVVVDLDTGEIRLRATERP